VGENFEMGHFTLTVGLALTAQVSSSTMIGAALPILARAVKLDPAVVASPAITTVVDIIGLLIYFGLAKVLLGL
jgi:magnesium transporter